MSLLKYRRHLDNTAKRKFFSYIYTLLANLLYVLESLNWSYFENRKYTYYNMNIKDITLFNNNRNYEKKQSLPINTFTRILRTIFQTKIYVVALLSFCRIENLRQVLRVSKFYLFLSLYFSFFPLWFGYLCCPSLGFSSRASGDHNRSYYISCREWYNPQLSSQVLPAVNHLLVQRRRANFSIREV